jgi:hypothetical protein
MRWTNRAKLRPYFFLYLQVFGDGFIDKISIGAGFRRVRGEPDAGGSGRGVCLGYLAGLLQLMQDLRLELSGFVKCGRVNIINRYVKAAQRSAKPNPKAKGTTAQYKKFPDICNLGYHLFGF